MKKNKNAFTLIELLAVIVILAVILVIAIPRILDVIETSKKDSIKSSARMIINSAEKKIYNSLDYEPVHIDSINEITGLSISDCLVNLLSLEFKGLVRQTHGKNFLRI